MSVGQLNKGKEGRSCGPENDLRAVVSINWRLHFKKFYSQSTFSLVWKKNPFSALSIMWKDATIKRNDLDCLAWQPSCTGHCHVLVHWQDNVLEWTSTLLACSLISLGYIKLSVKSLQNLKFILVNGSIIPSPCLNHDKCFSFYMPALSSWGNCPWKLACCDCMVS